MRFVVGIGNPEKKYELTRHNIGFRALDALREKLESEKKKRLVLSKEFQAEVAFLSDDVLLIKPQTYVNRTGESVRALREKYTALPSDFLFVCDDVNLPLGTLRLRGSGGAGGHHGLESALEAFGSEDFARLRIGVGEEGMPKDDLTDYVLGRFQRVQEDGLKEVLTRAVLVCKTWIEEGLQPALDKLSHGQSKQQGSNEE